MTIDQSSESALRAMFGGRFTAALAKLAYPLDFLIAFAQPQRIHKFAIALPRDDGRTEFLPAWRLAMADVFGPSKGGVRFHRGVDEASLSVLAGRILLKCAVNGLPHGGAAGGVRVDASALSQTELEALSRAYVAAVSDLIGEDRDILSPDLGTNARVMGWMADELRQRRGKWDLGAINGKLPAQGGVVGRHGATAAGAREVLEEVFRSTGGEIKSMTCAIQGFGAAGATLAQQLQVCGARIVAVSDSSAGLYDANGLDVADLAAHKERMRRIAAVEMRGARHISSEDVLSVPADLVVAAAVGGQVDDAVAKRMTCKMVIEIANAAVTSDGEAVLAGRKITVLPDVVVNAGGITVSHLEWTQNKAGLSLGEAEVRDRLSRRMREAARRMCEVAKAFDVPYTTASQIMAVERLKSAIKG